MTSRARRDSLGGDEPEADDAGKECAESPRFHEVVCIGRHDIAQGSWRHRIQEGEAETQRGAQPEQIGGRMSLHPA